MAKIILGIKGHGQPQLEQPIKFHPVSQPLYLLFSSR